MIRKILLILGLIANIVLNYFLAVSTGSDTFFSNLLGFLIVGFWTILFTVWALVISDKSLRFFVTNFVAFGILIIQAALFVALIVYSKESGSGPGIGLALMSWIVVGGFVCLALAVISLIVTKVREYLRSRK